MTTTIYCGGVDGRFHRSVEDLVHCGQYRALGGTWFFPEIDYGCRGGPIARHPARIIELVPDMVGHDIVTMSEHIVLAFQQLVRQKKIEWCELRMYCGDTPIHFGGDGDLEYWPDGFFRERLGLLR